MGCHMQNALAYFWWTRGQSDLSCYYVHIMMGSLHSLAFVMLNVPNEIKRYYNFTSETSVSHNSNPSEMTAVTELSKNRFEHAHRRRRKYSLTSVFFTQRNTHTFFLSSSQVILYPLGRNYHKKFWIIYHRIIWRNVQ